jgi:cytochrome c peroxidase
VPCQNVAWRGMACHTGPQKNGRRHHCKITVLQYYQVKVYGSFATNINTATPAHKSYLG